MESRNNVTYFVLLGLTQNPKEQKVLSVLFLFIYLLTLVGNLLIIVTSIHDKLARKKYIGELRVLLTVIVTIMTRLPIRLKI